MNKSLLTLLFVCLSASVFAKDFYNASVYYHNGTEKQGLVSYVVAESGEYVYFKQSEKSDVEKIESSQVKKVVYNLDDTNYEYVYIKVYKGWKQKEIKEKPMWLEPIKKGTVTLYHTSMTMGKVYVGSVTFHDYYVMRDGEPAAKLYATISTANNNQTFKAKAPLYFVDYPELAQKIKNKTYTWKNLEEVIDIYNDWAVKNKK